MEEIFKKIPNYSLYQCSNLGRIKTFNWKNQGIERIMKPALDGCGYLRTVLKRDSDGKLCTIKVHRIVGITWIDNPNKYPQINHLNGVRSDNRVINLEWCTCSQNIKHAYDFNNKSVLGEKNPSSIVTENEVLMIREKYSEWIKTQKRKDIADKYKISISALKSIIARRTWRHI